MSNDLEWLHKFGRNIFKNMRSLHAESMMKYKKARVEWEVGFLCKRKT